MEYHVKLLGNDNRVIATAVVEKDGDHYAGTVDTRAMPTPIRAIFEEYESFVDGQVLSRIDDVEDRINAFSFSVAFDDGRKAVVENLQVFPGVGSISFQVAIISGRAEESCTDLNRLR